MLVLIIVGGGIYGAKKTTNTNIKGLQATYGRETTGSEAHRTQESHSQTRAGIERDQENAESSREDEPSYNTTTIRSVDTSTVSRGATLIYLGEFKITAYSAEFEDTGKHPGDPWYGITATLTTVSENRTAAADFSILPPGTKIYIPGVGVRVIEDCGGAVNGKHIDLYFKDVTVCRAWGVQKLPVYIVR
jgi:3D (Asp-Asp-Asp) domain-containing protein